MKASISVLVGDRIDYHTTENFEDKEIEEVFKTRALPEKRLFSILEAIKLSHKDYDISQITNIIVSVVEDGDTKDECCCDKSLEYIKEIAS